jgi:phosphoglycerate-specific signal transduction histidine kinase
MARLGVDTLEKAQALQKEVEHRTEVQTWLRRVTERGQTEGTGSDS